MVYRARGWRRGPSRRSGIGRSLSPASRDPFSPQAPPTTPGARLGSGERGTRLEKEGGGEKRLVHAPRSLRVREQRAPAARVAIFSPSVCLSAVGFVRLQHRPSAHRHRLGSQLPSACWGPVPESPGLAGPSCSPGPIVRRSVCPEAGPRDPERRGAPRRRVKRPPTTSHPGQAEDAGAPQPSPLWVTGCWSFVCPCLGSGLGARSGRGAGAAQAPTHPVPRFPETRRDPTSSPPVVPLSAPLAREGRPCRRPPGVGPGRAWRSRAGTAPASDRLGRSWGRGRRMGVGVQTWVSVPGRRLAGRLLNLDFGEDCVV